MRLRQIVILVAALNCSGTSPAPFAAERALLDRVAGRAKNGSEVGAAALEILERVAEGRMDRARPELEIQVGLKPNELRNRIFKEGSLRAHAVLKIGESDLPESLHYLQSLRPTDLEPDVTGMVWPAVQVAVRKAEYERISDGASKTRFLEDTTAEHSAAASWAVNELCETGSYRSLGFVRESIQNRNPTPTGQKELAFCEARMGVILRSPDLIQALGSILSVREGTVDEDLIGWAVQRLEAIRSARADRELARYAKEIDDLPTDSQLKRNLQTTRAHLRNVLQMH